jgi:hypothetical protein
MNKEKLKKLELMVNEVMLRLSDLNPYIFHGPSKWGSFYIKFKDNEKLRSLRVADHKGIEKYRYKWNLVLGGITEDKADRGVNRFYYAKEDIAKMCHRIICYNEKIKEGQAFREAPPQDTEDKGYFK